MVAGGCSHLCLSYVPCAHCARSAHCSKKAEDAIEATRAKLLAVRQRLMAMQQAAQEGGGAAAAAAAAAAAGGSKGR